MSIYDTLLGTVGHGYAQANQNAMAQAQMPTFADRFLAGLRQNTEDEYKRRMGESTLAMNQAYKLSQEQHMREQERLGMLQRQSAALAPTRLVTPLTYDSAVAQVTGLGGQASWVPKQEFETGYENIISPQQDLQETAAGAGLGVMQDETFNPIEKAEYQTPIEGTGWGQESWQQELNRRNKLSIQELKGEQAAQVKRDKESQIAKLNRELEQKLISPQQHAMGIIKAVAIADSRAANLAGQGIMVSPLLNVPGAGGGLGGNVPSSVPGSAPQTGGTPAPATGETAPSKGLPAPDPNSVKGRENAIATAEVIKVADGALGNINSMRTEINGIASDPNKSAALSTEGLLTSKLPKSKSYDFNQRVESLKARLMMNAMAMLKSMSATGATGLGALSDKEGETLRMSIASLNANQSEVGFNRSLQTILDTFDRMERETLAHKNNLLRARGASAPTVQSNQAPGSVDSSNPLLQ